MPWIATCWWWGSPWSTSCAAPTAATTEYAGGSAANVAVALARLGRPVRFATSWADDERGRVLAEHLDRAGVQLASRPARGGPDSTALATIGADGAATYEFDLEWRLNPLADDERAAGRAHLLAGRGAGAGRRRRRSTLLRRLRATATISYDVNARPGDHRHRPRGGGAGRADGRGQRPGEGLRRGPGRALPGRSTRAAAAPAARRSGPAAVVVTRGGEGATWVGAARGGRGRLAAGRRRRHDRRRRHVRRRAARRALGARPARRRAPRRAARPGRREVAEVLDHASRAAAITVSRPGADPPYRHELD